MDNYIQNYEVVGCLDASQFAAVEEGPLGVDKRGDIMFCYVAGMICWSHWDGVLGQVWLTVVVDMLWDQKRNELNYGRRMSPTIDDVQRNVLNFLAPSEINITRLLERFDSCYWYSI